MPREKIVPDYRIVVSIGETQSKLDCIGTYHGPDSFSRSIMPSGFGVLTIPWSVNSTSTLGVSPAVGVPVVGECSPVDGDARLHNRSDLRNRIWCLLLDVWNS